MKLEKKFTVDLINRDNLVSKRGDFSSVYKVRDDNGEIYCGKLPKIIADWNYLVIDSPLEFKNKFSQNYLQRFSNCCLYEENIARDIWNKFDLAMKPEGTTLIKIEGVKNLFLPGFVNELAVNMNPQKLNEEQFNNYLSEREDAFKKILKDNYFVGSDSENVFNTFYSNEKGFKFNDFGEKEIVIINF